MRVRLLLLFVALTGYSFTGFAQSYEPGVLVRSTGDTLRGEIENAFWVEPPTSIKFRPAAGNPSQVFQPRQLRAVCLTGGRYFRYETLPIDHAAETRANHLPSTLAAFVHLDSLLAEVLVEGPATLLRAALPGSRHYFILTPGRPVLALCERNYLRHTNKGTLEIANGNNYHSQLSLYFHDCPAATRVAQGVPFTAEALGAVVQAYNESCSPARRPGRNWLANAQPRRRVALQGGVLAGVRYNNFNRPPTYSEGGCADCRPRPFAGLYADLFLPGRAAAIYGELGLSSFRFQNAQLVRSGQPNSPSSDVYSYYAYRAALATARIGMRYFFALPHEQQLIFGFSYELNWVLNPTYGTTAGPPAVPYEQDLKAFFSPTLLPGLSLGWRRQRLTLSLDGQMYITNSNFFVWSLFSSDFSARLGAAYRLSQNSDAKSKRPAQR